MYFMILKTAQELGLFCLPQRPVDLQNQHRPHLGGEGILNGWAEHSNGRKVE
jgi:hypothetical protein